MEIGRDGVVILLEVMSSNIVEQPIGSCSRLHNLPMIRKGMMPTRLTNLTPHRLTSPRDPTTLNPAASTPALANIALVDTGFPPEETTEAKVMQRVKVKENR